MLSCVLWVLKIKLLLIYFINLHFLFSKFGYKTLLKTIYCLPSAMDIKMLGIGDSTDKETHLL